jgi:uncharacterized protein YegP (UPF0339 family)
MWYRSIFLFALLHQSLALDSDLSLNAEISLPDDCDADNGTIHLFCIEAKLDDGSVYRIKHRYNDFHTLNQRLGELANNKFDEAPFPGKLDGAWCFFNFFEARKDCERDRLNMRRNALQTWLQRALKDPECKGLWKVPLQEFLHPEAKVGTRTIDGLKHDALSAADRVMAHAQAGIETITENAKAGIETIKENAVVDKLMTRAKSGLETMKENAKSGIEAIKENTVVDKVITHAKSGLETIKENAKSGIESIKERVASTETDL